MLESFPYFALGDIIISARSKRSRIPMSPQTQNNMGKGGGEPVGATFVHGSEPQMEWVIIVHAASIYTFKGCSWLTLVLAFCTSFKDSIQLSVPWLCLIRSLLFFPRPEFSPPLPPPPNGWMSAEEEEEEEEESID